MTSYFVLQNTKSGGGAYDKAQIPESVYDRVMRTGKIRCGYVVWPGNFEVDPNTGAFSGIAYDIFEAIGEELGYEIKWVEEVGWGTYSTGLNTKRYDVTCAPVWKSGQRANISLLTRTLFYENMYGIARFDDTRFDQNLILANKPDVTFAVIDGDITQQVRRNKFSNAKELALSPVAGSSPSIMSIVTKKADITMTNKQALENYNAANSNKVKLINQGKPIRQFPSAFAIKTGEYDLKFLLDSVIETLQTNGRFEEIIRKNQADLAPYQTNNK